MKESWIGKWINVYILNYILIRAGNLGQILFSKINLTFFQKGTIFQFFYSDDSIRLLFCRVHYREDVLLGFLKQARKNCDTTYFPRSRWIEIWINTGLSNNVQNFLQTTISNPLSFVHGHSSRQLQTNSATPFWQIGKKWAWLQFHELQKIKTFLYCE